MEDHDTRYPPCSDRGLAMSLTRATSPSFCHVKRPKNVTTLPSSYFQHKQQIYWRA